MEKRTPTQKSIVRHGLKMIDKKWEGRKVTPPAHQKALTNAEKALKHHQNLAKEEHNEKHFDKFKSRIDKLAKERREK
jgi:hypothetical protein